MGVPSDLLGRMPDKHARMALRTFFSRGGGDVCHFLSLTCGQTVVWSAIGQGRGGEEGVEKIRMVIAIPLRRLLFSKVKRGVFLHTMHLKRRGRRQPALRVFFHPFFFFFCTGFRTLIFLS